VDAPSAALPVDPAVLKITVDDGSAGYLVGPNQYAHKKGFAAPDDEVNVTFTINVSGNSATCFVSYSFVGGSSDGTVAQGKGCQVGTNNGLRPGDYTAEINAVSGSQSAHASYHFQVLTPR
jgi:hypothetical protein